MGSILEHMGELSSARSAETSLRVRIMVNTTNVAAWRYLSK